MGFENGIWKCDCDPSRPAEKRKVRSNANGNKGRWFWNCPKNFKDNTKCGFFLWHEEALKQEAEALQSIANNQKPSETTPVKREATPPTRQPVEAGPFEPGQKRKRPLDQVLEDDYDAGVDDDDLGAFMTEMETPSKATKTAHFATPATTRRKLPWQMEQPNGTIIHGLPTPQTNHRSSSNLFADYLAPRSSLFTPPKNNEEDVHQTPTPSSSFETPTRSRIENMEGDLTQDVLGLLHEANVELPGNSERELKILLGKYARRTEGYRRGRELAQQTVKARDAKVNELNLRVRTLEAELETEKQRVEHLEWEAQIE